ncbi:MAG: ABC transporter ATP-binding protein, partial [Planctomycetota bacterium]
EDAGGVAELIFSMLYNPWRAIVQFLGSLIILMLVDWKLMLGGLALLPTVWITHRTYINRIRPLYRDLRKQRQRIDSNATETFGGIRVVRTFSRARSESSRFVREGDFLVRQQLFTWWWTRIIEVIWEVLIPLASTTLLLYGGYQIIQGDLTLGDLMMFLVYLTMLLDPLATIAGSAVTFQNNLAGLDRILDVLEVEEELPSRPEAVTLPTVRRGATMEGGDISIRHVSFRYPETETTVLHDVSLEVQSGQTVALVGRSGAGKTTLTNLIARFYDPDAGSICLDGRDLRDVELSSYRSLLGIVEQDVFLFDGSIHENIAYARRRATRTEVIGAAKAAAADEFIERMADGYDTLIGERGVKLSGGQRQRLAIARAILADPQILILDEATSNLDSESEQLIQQSFRDLLQDRTAFVIAHRLSTIMHADKIVVMEDGRVVEEGTHEQLAARGGGRYQAMVHLQMHQGSYAG